MKKAKTDQRLDSLNQFMNEQWEQNIKKDNPIKDDQLLDEYCFDYIKDRLSPLDKEYEKIITETKKIEILKNNQRKKVEYDRLHRQLELLIQHYIAIESIKIRQFQSRLTETAIRDKIHSLDKIYAMQKQLNNLKYKSQLINLQIKIIF